MSLFYVGPRISFVVIRNVNAIFCNQLVGTYTNLLFGGNFNVMNWTMGVGLIALLLL